MNVIRLVAKDVWLQRGFVVPLIALELAGYFLYAVQMPSHIPGVAFGLLHGMALIGDFLICYRTIAAEEKNRTFLFVKTLPVSTAEIVIAKFVANLALVGFNTAFLLTAWGVGRGLGWIPVRPDLTTYLVVSGLTMHWLNNAFLVAVSLVFSSGSAVWVPFPALFAIMSAIVNFRRIEAALHLASLVQLLRCNHVLFVGVLWVTIVVFIATSSWALQRKRVFS